MSSQERWFQGRLTYAMKNVLDTLQLTRNSEVRTFAVKTALEVCNEIVPRRAELTPIHLAMLHGLIATVGYLENNQPIRHALTSIEICQKIMRGEERGNGEIAWLLKLEIEKILVLLRNEEADLKFRIMQVETAARKMARRIECEKNGVEYVSSDEEDEEDEDEESEVSEWGEEETSGEESEDEDEDDEDDDDDDDIYDAGPSASEKATNSSPTGVTASGQTNNMMNVGLGLGIVS